jgi:protoheme ferro-lyase
VQAPPSGLFFKNKYQPPSPKAAKATMNKKKAEGVLGLAEVLRESSSSFMHAGDVKASSFNTASLDKIDQEIKNLKNAHVQDAVKKKWETFLQTSSLNDYRDFIGTLADVIKDENGASLNKK